MTPPIHELPWYVSVTLWASVAVALTFLFFAAQHKKWLLSILGIWVVIVLAISLSSLSLPSWALPALVLALLGIASSVPSVKAFFLSLEVEYLHHLHLWRLPCSFVFLWYYQSGYSTLDSTFEGLNYDIVIGLTAPVIASLAFSQKMLNREILIGWNALGIIAWGIGCWLVATELMQSPQLSGLFSQLPHTWFFGFLMPLSLLSHLLSLVHLFKGDIEVES